MNIRAWPPPRGPAGPLALLSTGSLCLPAAGGAAGGATTAPIFLLGVCSLPSARLCPGNKKRGGCCTVGARGGEERRRRIDVARYTQTNPWSSITGTSQPHRTASPPSSPFANPQLPLLPSTVHPHPVTAALPGFEESPWIASPFYFLPHHVSTTLRCPS